MKEDVDSIEYCQPAEYLVSVAVVLGSFLCHVQACQIEHLFRRAVAGEHALCSCHFPVLAVEPFDHVCYVHYAPDFIGEIEEADVFMVVLPAADGIGTFPAPLLPDIRQRIQVCLLARGIVHCLEVGREFL